VICQIRHMGRVAHKLGLVAAGLADVTFTLTPENDGGPHCRLTRTSDALWLQNRRESREGTA